MAKSNKIRLVHTNQHKINVIFSLLFGNNVKIIDKFKFALLFMTQQSFGSLATNN